MNNQPILITPTMLRLLTQCERHIWLNAYGHNPDPLPVEVRYRLATGHEHEARVNQAMLGSLRSHLVLNWVDAVAKTRQLMQQGALVIVNGCLEVTAVASTTAVTLRSRFDQLVRIVSGRGQTPVYAPVEIKSYRHLSAADTLQMDAYLWLLTQIQGVEPSAGEFWLGRTLDDEPQEVVEHTLDEPRLLTALARVVAVLRDPTPPPAYIHTYCKGCPWLAQCRQVEGVRHDVAILNGLRQQTGADLYAQGITTLQQLAALPASDLTRFQQIGKGMAPALHAQACAWVEGRPVQTAPLPALCHDSAWFFDIETNPQTDDIWSIGLGYAGNGGHYREVIVVEPGRKGLLQQTLRTGLHTTFVPSADAAWSHFATVTATAEGPVHHWTGFDAANMRRHAPRDVTEVLNPRLHDLHGTFKKTVQIPAFGISLKTVAAYLGYHYGGYEDWSQAWADYQRWLAYDDTDALVRACTYQMDDVEATIRVWQWLNTL